MPILRPSVLLPGAESLVAASVQPALNALPPHPGCRPPLAPHALYVLSWDTAESLALCFTPPPPRVAPLLEQGFGILEVLKCPLLSKAVPDHPA